MGVAAARAAAPHAPAEVTTPASAPPELAASANTPSDVAAPSAPSAPSAASEPSAPPPSPALLANLPSRLALYPTEIAPLLRARCATCHGGKTPAGGLDITDYAALLHGGDTGPAITPGRPDHSLLVYRIRLPAGDDDHMPPSKAPQLTPNEVALINAWVEHDGTTSGEIALETLPGPAVEAIAAHPPARSASDVARASPAPRQAGCGACTVVDHASAPAGSTLAAVLLVAGFGFRRRCRSSAVSI